MKKKTKYWRWILGLTAVTAALNLLGCMQAFCDVYKKTVYGVISDALGILTSWIPFPLGEILGYLGALAVVFGLVVLVLLLFLRGKAGYRRFAAGYGKGFLFGIVLLLFVYTLNWILPFRGSILKVEGAEERSYTLQEVQNVRNYIVSEINKAAEEVTRDENGSVIYNHAAMEKATTSAMQAHADQLPLLSGFYPRMKDALCSDFLEWMDIGGYTYPYTMEITWNLYCNDLYYPFLFAHESAHHQGYYQENEANYVAFLACTQSDDPLIRFAGYNEIYYYLNNAYVETLYNSLEKEEATALYKQQPQVSMQVMKDRSDAYLAAQERYEAVSHPAQKLETVSSQVADVGWSTQADLLQENSYDGVVKMVLQYYDVTFDGLQNLH